MVVCSLKIESGDVPDASEQLRADEQAPQRVVACTVRIAFSAAPWSASKAQHHAASEFHPLDRVEAGEKLIGLADGAIATVLPFS